MFEPETFNSEVEIELDQYSVYRWKADIQWGINFEVRNYGIKSLSPFAPRQIIDLSRCVNKYLDDAEDELKDIITACNDEGINPETDKEVLSKRKEISAIKSLEKLELKDIECIFDVNRDAESSGDISVFPVRLEIDVEKNKGKLFFQK